MERETERQPSEDRADRELEASPAKGVIDESDPDPPEPSEPG